MKPVAHVTPELAAFAVEVLHDATVATGAHVDRVYAGRIVRAVVEIHTNGTPQNPAPHPHRGVALYEAGVSPDTDPAPAPVAPAEQARGVDVSHYQKGADFVSVAEAGYSFASIKVSEGMTIADDAAKEHHQRAGDNGLLRGAYLFFRPATSDPVAQTRRFVDLAGKIGPWELPPALDVEWLRQDNPATPVDESLGGLWPEEFARRVVLAVDELERLTGRRPLLYVAPGFWALLKGHADAAARCPLWLAHYTRGGAPPPRLAPWRGWTFWQWSATARVPGIVGNADVDKFHGTVAELRAWAAGG